MQKIVIIGLGGVGSVLINKIARFVQYHREYNAEFLLVDGDRYETKNFERQEFSMIGNKAEIKARELNITFNDLNFDHYNQYITENNISAVVHEDNVVLLCVDNHKTRKLVSDYCSQLNNIILLSGGNDYTDGNVQIYVRERGVDKTPNLTDYHPEIENPDDKSPVEMSCEELAQSDPQLYFANVGVATFMCWAFYNVVINKEIDISGTYFDLVKMSAVSAQRKPLTLK